MTRVLSWFQHSNKPVWYENPVTSDQTCKNITMTIPSSILLNDQLAGVADSYWMCGDDTLLNTLPARWIGLCTIVRMKLPVKVV